jgi:NAD(P)-dependent dehydrogenase (short-subunit alcohol dehydrogenase family)
MTASSQKVAIVTGAARGIGLAVAKRFLAEGWCVALLDIEAGLLKKSVTALAKSDATLAVTCDVQTRTPSPPPLPTSNVVSEGLTRSSTTPVLPCLRR